MRSSGSRSLGARGRRDLRVRHGHPQRPALLPVALQLRRRPLLRRAGSSSRRSSCTSRSSCRMVRRATASAACSSRCIADLARTRAEPLRARRPGPAGTRAADDQPPRPARRSSARVGGLLVVTAGSRSAVRCARLAVLAPRGRVVGDGGEFAGQPDRRLARITPAMTGAAWRLAIAGASDAQLVSARSCWPCPSTSDDLPIACVEGWSTTQRWTGVRLRDLAALAGAPAGARSCAWSRCSRGRRAPAPRSAPARGPTSARFSRWASTAPTCSLDHGYPARIIVPALPGVHCTKWVARLTWGRVVIARCAEPLRRLPAAPARPSRSRSRSWSTPSAACHPR